MHEHAWLSTEAVNRIFPDIISENMLQQHFDDRKERNGQNQAHGSCHLSADKERKYDQKRVHMQLLPTTCGEMTLLSSVWQTMLTTTTSSTIFQEIVDAITSAEPHRGKGPNTE